MSGRRDHEHDRFRYDPATVGRLQERFTITPVHPDEIRERADGGETLVTVDVPNYLGNNLASTADAAIALYRLVQLFGTPNVVGLEAGVEQPPRDRTTWRYLFRIEDAEGDVDGRLLSVYDHGTELSVGLSTWAATGDDRVAREPSGSVPDAVEFSGGGDLPDDELLRKLVQLVLSAVEHPVEATSGGRHV